MAKTYKDSECVDRIARDFVNNIIDGTESTVRKKIENAEYDKTFSCNILGINQVFSDEVKKDTQQYLIKTHSIPEISEKEEYYTVKIEGYYYCIKQASVYGMEQNVTVKVPNGEWNKMYISTAGKVKAGNVNCTDYRVTLLKDKWTAMAENATTSSGRYYTQIVDAEWSTNAFQTEPICDVVMTGGNSTSLDAIFMWQFIAYIKFKKGKIEFRSYANPLVDIDVIIKVFEQ